MARRLSVLLVGSGGREHALAWKLAQSPLLGELAAAPGNPGIARLARCLPVAATDVDRLVVAAREMRPDLVVVGPEDPLAAGLVDRLEAEGILAFGPTRAAARIESSKAFAKDLMRDAGVPTARYQVVDEPQAARRAIAAAFEGGTSHVVVKADGLALGKGVVVAADASEAEAVALDMLSGRRFGAAGRRVVIEEFLTGSEVSVLALVDGRTVSLLPPAQDHKRVGDGDTGPNTGGMGTVSPVAGCDAAMLDRIRREAIEPAVAALAERGCPFRGCLFTGLMLTEDGPRVLEFNARFGDPEPQSVLRRVDADLLELLLAAARGELPSRPVPERPGAAATVVMVSGGYPGDYAKNKPITGVEAAEAIEGVVVFHAGTATAPDGSLVTAGGRVLGVSASGPTLREALARAYRGVSAIAFEGAHYRRDIGHRSL